MATVGPVAVGVMLAFGWNLAASQPQYAAGDEPGVTQQVGQTGDELLRARSPCLRDDLLQPALLEPDGHRAAVEQAGAPHRAVVGHPVRGVAPAAPQR